LRFEMGELRKEIKLLLSASGQTSFECAEKEEELNIYLMK